MDSTALFNAIEHNELATAKQILQATPALANAKMANNVSLLMMAIYYGRQDIAQAIRSLREALDIWEATALGEVKSLATLLEVEDALINEAAADGFAPLGLAAFFGRVETLAWLLARGADVDQPSQNEMRVRPVHSATAHHNPDVALQMMQHLLNHGANPNVAQQGGWTPLHQAADHGHLAMVQLLLSHNADNSALSENGQSPAAMSQAKNHTDILRLLS